MKLYHPIVNLRVYLTCESTASFLPGDFALILFRRRLIRWLFFVSVLTCSLPSVPIPCTRPPNSGLLVSLSTPPSPASGDSSSVPTWFKVACGLEITVEFFMFSVVVTGACLQGFPPNSLWRIGERTGTKDAIW